MLYLKSIEYLYRLLQTTCSGILVVLQTQQNALCPFSTVSGGLTDLNTITAQIEKKEPAGR